MNAALIAAHLAIQQNQRQAEMIRRQRENERRKREAERRKEKKV